MNDCTTCPAARGWAYILGVTLPGNHFWKNVTLVTWLPSKSALSSSAGRNLAQLSSKNWRLTVGTWTEKVRVAKQGDDWEDDDQAPTDTKSLRVSVTLTPATTAELPPPAMLDFRVWASSVPNYSLRHALQRPPLARRRGLGERRPRRRARGFPRSLPPWRSSQPRTG